jgi:hypothetical protein
MRFHVASHAPEPDNIVGQRLEAAIGSEPSGLALRRAVERILYAGKSPDVVVLQDGSRIEVRATEAEPPRRALRTR